MKRKLKQLYLSAILVLSLQNLKQVLRDMEEFILDMNISLKIMALIIFLYASLQCMCIIKIGNTLKK